ncbi:MAG TPA: hypothetical protein VGO67_11745 [Verrucomicrobiae bacterium]
MKTLRKIRKTPLKTLTVLILMSMGAIAYAHDHMPAGATTGNPGATLEYAPTAEDFTTNGGWVFGLNTSTTNDPYMGEYWTDDSVFIALAATPDNGGPEPGHAAPGTYIQVKLLDVEGPPGSTFSFWETAGQGADGEGVDGTNRTWSVPVPYHNGTNLIYVSESDGSPGSDPYGHIHGRVYSVTKPGYYTATWQFVDTSTNGPDGGPVDLPSAPFTTQYQADLTIDKISLDTNSVNILMAAPSFLPDDAGPGTQPANYILESASALGTNTDWQPVGQPIEGDDLMHLINVPFDGATQFFRLNANYPAED